MTEGAEPQGGQPQPGGEGRGQPGGDLLGGRNQPGGGSAHPDQPQPGGEGGGDLLSGEPAPATGEGAPSADDWRAKLPEDIRADKSLQDFKSPEEAIKGYVNLVRKMGVPSDKLLAMPDGEEGWEDAYRKLGRPEAAEEYEAPKLDIDVDEQYLGEVKKAAHEAGLNNQQFQKVVSGLVEAEQSQLQRSTEHIAKQREQATNELKNEWGDKFAERVNLANRALRHHFSDETVKAIRDSGLANNPEMVRAFAGIGEQLAEDGALGTSSGNIVADAKAQIEVLNRDQEFQKALHDRHHPQHNEAITRRERLYREAYPEEQPA